MHVAKQVTHIDTAIRYHLPRVIASCVEVKNVSRIVSTGRTGSVTNVKTSRRIVVVRYRVTIFSKDQKIIRAVNKDNYNFINHWKIISLSKHHYLKASFHKIYNCSPNMNLTQIKKVEK